MREKGLEVVNGDPAPPRSGPFSADDRARSEAFFRALSDGSSDAVLSTRGGYGAIRLLPHLDLCPWNKAPLPLWTGFSDATNLHAYLWNRLNAVTFHGPHLRGLGSSPESFRWFWEMVSGEKTAGSSLPLGRAEVIRPGSVQGRLLGGNLETLAHMAGTRWFPDLKGAILLLEDVDEPLYAIDRAFSQLAHMGVFSAIAGLILGPFSGRSPREDDPANNVLELLETHCPPDIPILSSSLPGHDLPMATWPMNVDVRMNLPDSQEASLVLAESPFQET